MPMTFHFGAEPERQLRTKTAIHDLFPGKHPEAVAAAVGAVDGSHVGFSSFGKGHLVATIKHPHYTATRIVERKPDGSIGVYNNRLDVAAGATGFGTDHFAKQVEAAHDLGVHHLTARGSSDNGDNGGYTVPLWGFNGPVSHEVFSSLSPEVQAKMDAAGKRDYHTLMAAGGREELKQKHQTTDVLHFDLHPDSEHRKRLNGYLTERQQRPAPVGGATVPAPPGTAPGRGGSGAGGGAGAEGTVAGGEGGGGPAARVPLPEQPADNGHAVSEARLRRAGLKFHREPEPQAHRLVRGFRLEHVLRHLSSHGDSETTRTLARQALNPAANPGLQHMDPDDVVTNSLRLLHDSLRDDGHPLAEEYNFANAVHGVHLDAATEAAVGHLAGFLGREKPDRRHHRAATYMEAALTGGQVPHPAFSEAVAEIAAHSGADTRDLLKSVRRSQLRHQDAAAMANPTSRSLIPQDALRPSAVPEGSGQHPLIEASRYDRLRERVARYAQQQKQSKFSSTHILLEGAAAAAVAKMAAAVADSDLGEDGRETEPHVTVRYGLHTDAAEEVAALLSRVRRPIRYRLGRVGVFRGSETGKDYDVVKVEVNSPDLHKLNGLLKSLPHTDTWPDYKPHATIAYVKAGLGDRYAARFGAVNADGEAAAVEFSNRSREKTLIPVGGATRYSRPKAASDFVAALRRVRSRNQDALRAVAEAVHRKLKLKPVTVRDAIHDHPHSATANVAQSLVNGDRQRARLAAAWTALQSQTPSVAVFHVGRGQDSVYHIRATGSGERLRAQLDRHGLPQRLLLPTKSGFDVVVLDRGTQFPERAAAFAKAVGGRIRAVQGEAELLGGSSGPTGDEHSRRSLRGVIREHEKKQQPPQPPQATAQPAPSGIA